VRFELATVCELQMG